MGRIQCQSDSNMMKTCLDGLWTNLASDSLNLVKGSEVLLNYQDECLDSSSTGLLAVDSRSIQMQLNSGKICEGELTDDFSIIKWAGGEVWEREWDDASSEDEASADGTRSLLDEIVSTTGDGIRPASTCGMAGIEKDKLSDDERARRHFQDAVILPCSDEQMEQEYGYPATPDDHKDPTWWKKEGFRLATDPRHNPSLLVTGPKNGQDFWDNAMRYPWAKTILKKEAHWNSRRNVWSEQYKNIKELNESRAAVGELLEDCPTEIKRLVAPILRYKLVQGFLRSLDNEAKKHGIPFQQLLQKSENISALREARCRLDAGGEEAAKEMQDDFDFIQRREKELADAEQKRKEHESGRVVIDMAGLKLALETGQKCKQNGLREWQNDSIEDALVSWREGDEILKRFRAPYHRIKENQMIIELHGALLKNISQAAIKLERWSEALEAADRVIDMDVDDHKAWFRKACALEGLGMLDDVEKCLLRIQEIAVGRADRERITKDVDLKLERLQVLRERDKKTQQTMLQNALEKGFFSCERDLEVAEKTTLPDALSPEKRPLRRRALNLLPTAKIKQKPKANESLRPGESEMPEALGRAGKRITRDATSDLLDVLESAYTDPWVCQRIDKLIGDVRFNPDEFLHHVGNIALDVQKPILEKWGFEPSARGMEEMKFAIRDNVRSSEADPELASQADRVNRALYGSPDFEMYERVQHHRRVTAV
mmetsp:Transcript_5411/g.8798  ORF Transcript_5411/g.8798 Transcript_5411/m.8798 type:complete len:714 (-) Transcript_5411:13-2154(-)